MPRSPRVKRPVLEALFERFREREMAHRRRARRRVRRASSEQGGAALADFATFEALARALHCGKADRFPGTMAGGVARPGSPAVAEFARAHAERVDVLPVSAMAGRPAARHRQPRRGAKPGLALGLYRDLAVGVNPHGAEAWADHELVVPGPRSARRPTR